MADWFSIIEPDARNPELSTLANQFTVLSKFGVLVPPNSGQSEWA